MATTVFGGVPANQVHLDTDTTLAANSDTRVATQKATKAYADTKQASLGFTPLNPANNLSDVASAATARTNLGIQTTLKTLLNASFSSTSTSLVNITQGADSLNFAVGANEKWIFEIVLRITNTNTNGVRCAITFPAGAFLMARSQANTNNVSSFIESDYTVSGTEAATSFCQFTGAGTITFRGSIINGATPGTLQLQIRNFAAQTLTVSRGSWIRAEKF